MVFLNDINEISVGNTIGVQDLCLLEHVEEVAHLNGGVLVK